MIMRNCPLDRYGAPVDQDKDGSDAIAFGGDDCDDGDVARFRGNTEVCDTFNHDEDCDPRTTGGNDADHDILTDGACCNLMTNGAKFCSMDCDDKHGALALDGQRCNPDGSGTAQVCEVNRAGGGQVPAWTTHPCSGGGKCKPQENGTGICL